MPQAEEKHATRVAVMGTADSEVKHDESGNAVITLSNIKVTQVGQMKLEPEVDIEDLTMLLRGKVAP
jgi:hypothetical protein